LIEENKELIAEIEAKMEEEYDYSATKDDVTTLQQAVKEFMTVHNLPSVARPDYTISLVCASRSRWDDGKLKKILGKAGFLKIAKITVDPAKIDELVKEGKLDLKKIESAFIVTPNAPYLKFTPKGREDTDEVANLKKRLAG